MFMEVTVMLSAQEMRAISQVKCKDYTMELLSFIYEGIKGCASKGYDYYNTAYMLSVFKGKNYDQAFICKTLENLGYQIILANGELYKVTW